MKPTVEYVLNRGVESILPSKRGLKELLKRKKLTIYQGFDPTSPSLHIGHLIGIRKLAQFQRLGHKIVFLIGDFTGMIGDPTDKSSSRKRLSKEEVLKNSQGYKDQIKNIIDFTGKNKAEIKHNSTWLGKLNFEKTIELASNFTVGQMLERDFFQERIKNNLPIHLHEFLYPLMQGYDCVAMDVDLEIGGNDQLFNMMAGRTLMKNIKGKEKYVLTMKLLTDPEGRKMGKTEGNAINLTDTSRDIYGKVMAMPDSLIEPAQELLTDLEINKDNISKNPMEEKKKVAYDLVKQLRGENEADQAQAYFEQTFQESKSPTDINTIYTSLPSMSSLATVIAANLATSKSEAKRLIKDGGIEIEGNKVTDPNKKIAQKREGLLIKRGKHRFTKLVLR